MKFQVKTTALAILVSLGVVACKSNDTSSQKVDPTPINQPEQPQPQPEQSQPQPEQPQPQPEQPQPQPEQPQPQPEQPQPQPEQPQPQPEQPQPQPEQPQPQPEQPQPQPEQPPAQPDSAVNRLDKKGVEWRFIGMNGSIHSSGSFFSPNTVKGDHSYVYSDNKSARNVLGGAVGGVNGITKLNLNSATEEGKPFLGVHQGTYSDPDFGGEVVTGMRLDNDEIIIDKEDAKAFNYLYINQPYSSYGALFTNQHESMLFRIGLNAGEEGNSAIYPVYKYEEIERDGNTVRTGRIIWNDAIVGESTYKGNVIAAYKQWNSDFGNIGSVPTVDGTVTLNAKFDKDLERTYVSGEIDSKILGKISLQKENVTLRGDIYNTGYYNARTETHNGIYRVNFLGQDYNDVTGHIYLEKKQPMIDSNIKRYEAVFGATRQPK